MTHVLSTAPGKLILLGEYAVLEGAPALVAAVDRFARVDILSAKDYLCNSPTLNITDVKFEISRTGKINFLDEIPMEIRSQLVFFTKTMEYFLQNLKRTNHPEPFQVKLNTDDFYLTNTGQKLGLGSSAALTAALINGLQNYCQAPLDSKALFIKALEAHYFSQGKKGSGIDVAASCFGGILEFQRSAEIDKKLPRVTKTDIPDNLKVIPIWSGTSTSTREFVTKVMQFKESNPKEYGSIMENLSELSHWGCQSLRNDETSKFLEICNQYFYTLMQLGESSGTEIVSDVHKKIAKIVQLNGGVYKSSGAGGGDIGIAFTDSPNSEQNLKDALLYSGFEILNLNLENSGAGVQRISQK